MNVGVLGVGIEPFVRRSSVSITEMGARVTVAAVTDAGLNPSDIDVAYVGSSYETTGVGQRVLKELRLTGIPIHNLENACASGSDAVLHAARSIEHGEARYALALGLDAPGSRVDAGPLPLDGEDWLVSLGMTAPAVYALRAQRYMYEYGVTAADFATVTVKNRQHGSLNEIAAYRSVVTIEDVLSSPMIADPLTRLQCCPVSDGAAAVVVGFPAPHSPRIVGGAIISGTSQESIDSTDDVSRRAAMCAFEECGVDPDDLDFCEVHDAFTIGEVLAIEALGICEAGAGSAYIGSGAGTLPRNGTVVNPSGGLLARGHPPGATGVAQLIEATLQLSGRAGDRTIPNVRMGACHTRGGGSFDLDANACAVIIVGR